MAKPKYIQRNDDFMAGLFAAMQHLVLELDQPSMAADLAREYDLTQAWALAESRRTGYQVRRMNRFIRRELPAFIRHEPPPQT